MGLIKINQTQVRPSLVDMGVAGLDRNCKHTCACTLGDEKKSCLVNVIELLLEIRDTTPDKRGHPLSKRCRVTNDPSLHVVQV